MPMKSDTFESMKSEEMEKILQIFSWSYYGSLVHHYFAFYEFSKTEWLYIELCNVTR